jgi:hypothetical protein
MKARVICLTILLFVAGGCIVRPAADTILTINQPNKPSLHDLEVGFRDVYWSQTEDELLVVGYGWSPHKTYVFFMCEPYPAYLPRYIRITSEETKSKAAQDYKVELLLSSFLLPRESELGKYCKDLLYVDTISCRARTFFGRLYINLKDLRLTRMDKPTEVVKVSGRVVAKRASQERIVSMSEKFDFACQPLPDRYPDNFILSEDAVELFGISKSVLSEGSSKKPGEVGYLWSCETKRGIFYLKKDIEVLAARRGKLK